MGLKTTLRALLSFVRKRISRDLRETYPEWELVPYSFSDWDWFERTGAGRDGSLVQGEFLCSSLHLDGVSR